ncbi:hypothetical protein [Streptomyces sp. NPDC059881]|uniref:hypothetical protein n=1 Tax=Streptomyces sp. NPDC059881 TaxID=3346986 RepID=UPI00364ADA2D
MQHAVDPQLGPRPGHGAREPRLLPWRGPEGKPCYVIGDGHGPVSRLADQIEAVQLGLAGQLLDQVQSPLDEPDVTPVELHTLVTHLSEALSDVLRIVKSRGHSPGDH